MTLAARGVVQAPARGWRVYPDYKDSGVEWLGEVPAHWRVKKLKYTVTACQNGVWGDEPTGGPDDLVCVRVADFDRTRNRVGDAKLTMRSVPASQLGGKELKQGDLLIEKSGGGDLQPVGTVVLYDLKFRAVCSNFVARMPVADSCSSSFLCYLHAALYAGRINTRSIKQNTGIQNLDSNSYLREKVGLPSLPEQTTIAAFLDRETKKIDDLITKRERLIELLEEKRTALINRAVTKGLDPKVRMKDSGVEWLGEIPRDWEMKRLKHLTSLITSGSRDWSQYYSDKGAVFIRIGNLTRTSIDLKLDDIQHVDLPDGTEGKRTLVKKDDLLLSITAFIGSVAVAHDVGEAYVSQHIALARPHRTLINGRWVAYSLLSQSGQSQFRLSLYGGTKDGLGLDDVKNLMVPIPPIHEQDTIVDFVEHQSAKIDTLRAKLRTHIEKLREYRMALISAVVTGKIDVREEVP